MKFDARRRGEDGSAATESGGRSTLTPDPDLSRRLFPSDPDALGGDVETAAGCQLGHFAIEERIGAGGMGAVFRALDTRLQRVVALKVLSPAQSRDRAAVLRFENEAQAAARLDHENIARVHYFGEDRGLYFIAFEYVTGQNVRDLIARTGRLPVADAVNYVLQIATALRHTASAGVVHRDIKPSNIIIAPNGRAKLVDLGLARKLAAEPEGDLTVAGTTLGTFDYISPEQARDPRNVDVRSDIYSLGCTLYHMLTGGPPYSSGTVLQKLLDHQSGQAPDPREINPQVPPALSAICRKMMAGDARERFATPDELIRELAVVAAGLGLRPLPTDGYLWSKPVGKPAPRLRSHLVWAGTFAAVILLAFFMEGFDGPTELDAVATGPRLSSGDRASAGIRAPRLDRDDPLQNSTGLDGAVIRRPDRRQPVGSDEEIAESEDAVSAAELAEQARRIGELFRPVLDPFILSETSEERPVRVDDTQVDVPPLQSEPLVGVTSGTDAAVTMSPTGGPRNAVVAGGPRTGSSDRMAERAAERADNPERYAFTRPFVVWPGDGAELQGYDSLADAVAFASSGDVIELHFDGRSPGFEASEPLVIDDKSVTIRAGTAPSGEPYRPLVEFVGDPRVIRPPYMIAVTGDEGCLLLEGVELRVTVTGEAPGASGQWELFSIPAAEEVRLRNVAITLVNVDGWPLAAFGLRPPEDVSREAYEIKGMMDESRADGFLVELENCLVRGEADLIAIGHTLPGRISMRDSAFALETALLNVTGGLKKPPAGDSVDVRIDHVTAVTGGAVLQLALDRLPRHAPTIRVEASNSVFASASEGQLVLMTGSASLSTFEQSLSWNGRNNVFDGFSQFWSIFTEDGASDAAPTTFDLWTARWAKNGARDPRNAERAVAPKDLFTDVWADPQDAKKTPRSTVTAADLALDAERAGELLRASDGGPIGASPAALPPVTSPPGGLSAAARPGSAR